MSSLGRDDTIHINAQEYSSFCGFLQKNCGIDLGQNKQYLVATRVRRIIHGNNIASLSELITLIQQPSQRLLRQQVIDAMTTNETFWFRDGYPFDYLLNKLLPQLHKEKIGGNLRIWSAACSSGQEPYSISMMVEDFYKKNPSARSQGLEIVATDLSSVILEQAKSGIYDKISISRGLSLERMEQFFEKSEADTWRAKNSIRDRISFRALNLQDSYYMMGKFDVIFCRNVLIYFSQELKTDILRKLHGQLNKNGVLFLGSSESLTGVSDCFDMIDCAPGVAYRAK
jgi:chemotaxis protein methyltransferase CheR